ncbi:hypothetical protein TrLO_g7031 [Triparma laevis f. longispina]|uniref:LOV domain-containing protein n=2 Tax=Triparma laevis TaxID=1534972 RepID=A0A9W7ECC5_9STRA|nr:hypothetical protein TrLO_g7031 [Triparma laevis f. longispina]
METSEVKTPFFTQAGASGSGGAGGAAALNIDDLFGDCFFTPNGETVFLDQSDPTSTHLTSSSGLHPPSHQLGFVTTQPPPKSKPKHPPKKRPRPTERKMSEQQKVERRERNREHAKRSRIRKKFLLESLQQSVALLKEENEKLRGAIKSHLGEEVGGGGGGRGGNGDVSLIANDPAVADKVLDDPDFSFIKALQTAQQNFVVTDPSLPDNPIVYATQGFLSLTGYTLPQVLGRNCRFLQGPDTDPKAVEKIRLSIEQGNDMSVCLLNYRVDGSTFWNQFFIAALRDANGDVTNYVGVQCKVSEAYARSVCKKQMEEDEEEEEEEDLGDMGDLGDLGEE